MPSMVGGLGGGGGCEYNILVWTLNFTLQCAVLEILSRSAKTCERNSSQCLFGYFDEMAAFRKAYDIIQQTMETLDNPAITSFEIDGILLRLDYLTHTLVNRDSNCTPTDDIVQLLGEAIRYLRDMDSTVDCLCLPVDA